MFHGEHSFGFEALSVAISLESVCVCVWGGGGGGSVSHLCMVHALQSCRSMLHWKDFVLAPPSQEQEGRSGETSPDLPICNLSLLLQYFCKLGLGHQIPTNKKHSSYAGI